MTPLTFPNRDDDAVIKKICKNPVWATHQTSWLAAYSLYKINKGNPWVVQATVFNPDVKTEQQALYESRKSSGPLRRIRQTKVLCCPMCGSPTTGDLDHYLPKVEFPEFSIFGPNLVPACTHCNSSGKRKIYKGNSPERFIHPYYDKLGDKELWQVTVVPPYEAATFEHTPSPDLDTDERKLVAFHLQHVLGWQFKRFIEGSWSTYPQLVVNRAQAGTVIADADVAQHVRDGLKDAVISSGLNSWRAAFLRGLGVDRDALNFIAMKATALNT